MSQTIIISKGNDVIIYGTVIDPSTNLPIDLTNYSARCEIKQKAGIELISGTVTITNSSQGLIQIYFPAGSTILLEPKTDYFIDVEFTDSLGRKFNFPKPPSAVIVYERITD